MSDERSYEITSEGFAALEAELAELEGPARTEMAERIKTARAWGDLKENAEYHDAKNSQAHLETKILRLQDRRRNAVIIKAGSSDGSAAMGSKVATKDQDSGREATYEIVSANEADAPTKKISIESPLARSLIGAQVGEIVQFQAPKGTRHLLIVAIS